MTFPAFPTGSTIRADATFDDLLDWYHWGVADGADNEAFLLAAVRKFPQWASELKATTGIDTGYRRCGINPGGAMDRRAARVRLCPLRPQAQHRRR